MISRPGPSEAAPYYFLYIDRVSGGQIIRTLAGQLDEALVLCSTVTEEQSLYRYADDKWSIRQVLSHLTDTERVFALRAFWFARGFDTALPSFDQKIAARGAEADAVAWPAHIEEFRRVRLASISLFENTSRAAWMRTGMASDNCFTVRSLAYLIAGHTIHHLSLLRERYLR